MWHIDYRQQCLDVVGWVTGWLNWFSALGVSNVMCYINVRYLLTYLNKNQKYENYRQQWMLQ